LELPRGGEVADDREADRTIVLEALVDETTQIAPAQDLRLAG
jgi:hypothetical protein